MILWFKMVNEIENILQILIENSWERLNIRKLSILRKINYKSAYNAIMALEKQGVIGLQRLGNTTICSFNKKFNPLVFKVEYERRNDLLKDKNFKVINSRLDEIKSPFIALLFGSWVKKTATKNSDIDILFIADEKAEKEIKQAISLIPLKIHPTIINYSGFIEMANSRKFSVVTEAIKNNIILKGIEEYYHLLKKC